MTPTSKTSGPKSNRHYPIFKDTSTITTTTSTIASSASNGTPSFFLIGANFPLPATKEANRQLNPRGPSMSRSNGRLPLPRDRTPAPQLKDALEKQPPLSLVQSTSPSPYTKASNARRAVRESLARTDKAHKMAAELREVQREKACLTEIEA